MSDDLVVARISRTSAAAWLASGALMGWLRDKGIDTTTMTCIPVGPDLVYSSLPVKKGNGLTKDNRGEME